jgi:excisionase family DNA binding protein
VDRFFDRKARTLMRRLTRHIEPLLYSVTDLASAINFSRSKVYEMIKDKQIPYIVVEGRIRVRRKDLLAWIDGNSRQH